MMHSKVLDTKFSSINKNLFNVFENKTILITGATGLVGSVFCKMIFFANQNYNTNINIVAIVRNADKANKVLDGYLSNEHISIIESDIRTIDIKALPKVDYILHAAAITKSKQLIEKPVDVIESSFEGTRRMLNVAKRDNSKLVYLSSMEYYGTLPDATEADETKLGYINLASVRSCYPESKRMCECLCTAYASQYNINVCCARLAQTFGAGVLPNETRAFMQFAKAALDNKPIELNTTGQSQFNHVNIIDAMTALLILFDKGKAAESYNVANMAARGTIKEMAKSASIKLNRGKSAVIINVDNTNNNGYAADVKLKLDSSKLTALAWKPLYSLQDSFQQLADYAIEQSIILPASE